MKNVVVYVHGKGGSASEAEHYKIIFPYAEVIGYDYKSETPWEAKEEFLRYFAEKKEKYGKIILIANSIGAFFSMSALDESSIEKAYFVSPIVDMEKLILDMLLRVGASEDELKSRGEIATDFGETLSWRYLCYVRENPIKWNVPTCILYGEHDNLTSFATISDFAARHGAKLTVMQDGEHWFHTAEEMNFLDSWLKNAESLKKS